MLYDPPRPYSIAPGARQVVSVPGSECGFCLSLAQDLHAKIMQPGPGMTIISRGGTVVVLTGHAVVYLQGRVGDGCPGQALISTPLPSQAVARRWFFLSCVG